MDITSRFRCWVTLVPSPWNTGTYLWRPTIRQGRHSNRTRIFISLPPRDGLLVCFLTELKLTKAVAYNPRATSFYAHPHAADRP